jgi:hypothetical protein
MAPHLLTLPGEIRNCIYKYALTEEDGVCYRQDEHGNGWLCKYEKDEGYGEIGGKRDDIQSDSPTSSVGADSLGEKNGQTTSHDAIVRICNGAHVIANQIQFACRQLLKETKQLCIRYNVIVFSGYNKGILRCNQFIQALTPEQMQVSFRLTIKHRGDLLLALLAPLAAFCNAHLNMVIDVHDCDLKDLEVEGLLVLVCCYGKWVRNSRPIPRLIYPISTMIFTPGHNGPSNLRLRYGHGAFNEALFRTALLESEQVQRAIDMHPNLDIDGLVVFAREFMEVGFPVQDEMRHS